ncbi:MAG TPA: BON domain-containing protein [Azonexus sp.]|nr:BON domain-containing protein [Azonexus sp.]
MSSRDQIERASEVTRKVKGVKSVINDLRLK